MGTNLIQTTLWDASNWDTELIWDHTSSDIKRQIKKDHSRVFRKAFLKRRQLSDGLFESTWLEVTKDVKRWGSISSNVDFKKHGRLIFSGTEIVMQNIEGKYNPDDNADSHWSGFANQQRSLFKIEVGFYHRWQGVDGVWINESIPDDPTVFVGVLSGNIGVSDSNEVVLPIKPLSQVFRDFPSDLIDGFTSTGITSNQFMEMVRDQTDGSGSFVFRPFFGDTVTNWEITATSVVYSNLNTSTVADLKNKTTWDVIERLAQSENFISYITPTGKFRWVPKTVGDTATFEFFGLGINPNREYGHTIKRIFKYGKKLTNFYSRVAVKFIDEITNTSFAITSLPYEINGTNTAWNLGHRTFSIENFWIPDTATANSVAGFVFSEVSSLDEEINFSTSLVPHLNLLDRVNISYDATDFSSRLSLWDINAWDTELIWDASRGDAIVLTNEPFKILSININIDNLETRFVCRQLNL